MLKETQHANPILGEVGKMMDIIQQNYFHHSLSEKRLQGNTHTVLTNVDNLMKTTTDADATTDKHALTRVLLECSTQPIFVTYPDSTILYVNPALEELTGYKSAELMGKKLPYPWWSAEKRANYTGNNLKTRSQDLRRYEMPYVRKNGDPFRVIATIKHVNLNEDMKVFLVAWEDITSRKENEERVKISEDRCCQIFESVTSGIAVYNAENNGADFIIKKFNSAAEKATGVEAIKVFGRRVTEVFPEIKNCGLFEVFQRVWRTGVPESKSASLYKDNRLSLWVENYVFLLSSGELVAVFDNITERKKAEDEKRKAQDELKTSLDKINRALQGYIDATSKMVEMRDPYTAGHQHKVAELSEAIALEMGLPEKQIECIRVAAQVHDIGKICVPAEILCRPGILSDLEFAIVKSHVQGGYDILKTIDFPWPIANTVLQHHERMNGTGYPNGLKGDEISLEARIMAVSDTVEAMTMHRPYRPAPGLAEALKEIERNKGILYDEKVVDACTRLFCEERFRFQQGNVAGTVASELSPFPSTGNRVSQHAKNL